MTRWGRWSTGNCARNLNLNIRSNAISTNQNRSWRIRHKIFWDFEIQRDHLISTRHADLTIINKKKEENLWIVNFSIPEDHRMKLKEWQVLGLCQITKKTVEHEGDSDTYCYWCTLNNPQRLGKGFKKLEIRGWMETIQTTALLKTARILRRALKTRRVLLSHQWKTIS